MIERTESRTRGRGIPALWGDDFRSEIILNNGSALIVLVEVPNPHSNVESAFHLLSCCIECVEPLAYVDIDGAGTYHNWACATKNGCGRVSTVSNVTSTPMNRFSPLLFIEIRNTIIIEEWFACWLDIPVDSVEVDLRGLVN